MDMRAVFLKAYANLPLGARDEIVVVLDDQPMTWNAVYLELKEDTPKGRQALEQIVQLGILKHE